MPIHIDVSQKKSNLLQVIPSGLSSTGRAILSGLLTNKAQKDGTHLIATCDYEPLVNSLRDVKAPDVVDVSIAALSRVQDYQNTIAQFRVLKNAPVSPEFMKNIQGWKTSPYPDQVQCINFHTAWGRSLEMSETGCGKSLSLLYTYLYWKTQKIVKHGLFLTVNSGKPDWSEQVTQHTTLKALTVGNGTNNVADDIQKFLHGNYDILIAHYDCLIHGTDRVFELLKKINFGFVCLDECHVFKNPQSQRHKRVMELVESLGDVKLVCASGTAMDGNPKSAWAPLKLIHNKPGVYFPGYYDFFRHFVTTMPIKVKGRHINVETGYKNLRDLKKLLEPVSIRFLKSEVMGRPSKIFQTRFVTLGGAQEKMYNEIKKAVRNEILTEDGDTISVVGVATRILRLRQILNHPSLISTVGHYTGDSAKYSELDDVVEEILSNPEAQMLVWTQWREAVNKLVQRYKNFNAIAYYGGSDDKKIREAVLQKKARIVVAIPEKAGTSVDFLKVCRTAVFLERPFSLSLYRQSLDRIDRRSNTDAALIIDIHASNSVDMLVNAILRKKQEIFESVTLSDEKLVSLGKEELLSYLS